MVNAPSHLVPLQQLNKNIHYYFWIADKNESCREDCTREESGEREIQNASTFFPLLSTPISRL